MLQSSPTTQLRSVKPSAVSDQKPAVMIEIDPERCRPWSYHNRDQAWLTRERCVDLIDSIQKNGQIEPVIVRALESGSGKYFEIIAGVRRWFSCLQIPGQKLLVRVIEADDRSCMLLMHAENADSQDISDFERAYSFAIQLKSGAFKNQTDLAKAVGLSQSTICKMIKATELFEKPWLAVLFESKLEIPIRLAYRLSSLLKKPDFYRKIEAEVDLLLEEKKKTQSGLRASTILRRLIQCVRLEAPIVGINPLRQGSFKKNKVLFKKDEKPIVVAREDQAGNFSLNIASDVRAFNRDQISALCVKAVQDYFIVE